MITPDVCFITAFEIRCGGGSAGVGQLCVVKLPVTTDSEVKGFDAAEAGVMKSKHKNETTGRPAYPLLLPVLHPLLLLLLSGCLCANLWRWCRQSIEHPA